MSGSVVRTPNTRRHNRVNNASPYSRPNAKRSSGWSLTGLLSYLNPLRARSPPAPVEDETSFVEGDAPSRLAARGQELQSEGVSRVDAFCSGNLASPVLHQPPTQFESPIPNPPASSSHTSPVMNGDHRISPHSDESQTSSSENLKKVQQFLDDKAGRPLNHIELAGLVHLLQNSVEDDDERPEPFRFSKSPSTPARGTTPVNFLSPGTSEQMVSAAGKTAQNARRTLAKNPMGVYRWQGGGSARVRNRYQSPSFGSTPSRSTIKLVPEKPKMDTKRRRVGEAATPTTPQRAGATSVHRSNGTASTMSASVSAPAALNGMSSSNGGTNGTSATAPPTTPRIRTNGIKPTAPVVPSPLRQTWSQSDSPPQASSPQPVIKPTRAASFMAELIKEVTPPKKPDFANPYEAANLMVKPPSKKQPARRTRSAAKAEAPKEPELTPQAIIEATVPKGSKRSRPPPDLIGTKPSEKTSPPESSAPRRSTRLNGAEPSANGLNGKSTRKYTTVVEEVSDEEQQPSPPKKHRTLKSPPATSRRTPFVTVEEIEDVDMPTTTTSSSRSAPAPTYTLPSEIVEPEDDKKRSTSPTPAFPSFGLPRSGFSATKSSAPKAPSKLRFSINAEKDDKMDVTPSSPVPAPVTEVPKPVHAPAKKPETLRAFVAAMREEELPKYTFTLATSSPGAGPSTLKALESAVAAPLSSLPSYDFSKSLAPASKPPIPFDWKAAGMQPLPSAGGDMWKCSMCMLSNPANAQKCTVCEEPKPQAAKAAAPMQGFNWGAVGAKPPTKPAGQWSCSTCMLSNPNSAMKCTVCDAPR